MDGPATGPATDRVEVLGPCRLAGARATAELTRTQRRIVARLAAVAPVAVPVGLLAEAVWGDTLPATAKTAVLNQISRIRAAHGDHVIVTSPHGYQLGVPTDLQLVAQWIADAERMLADDEHAGAFDLMDRAVTTWRGTAFVELSGTAAEVARVHADELRVAAENLRLTAGIRLGTLGWAVPEAERMVGVARFDEARWALLAEALDAAGRRGDALATLDRARVTLREGLGLDPGPTLRNAAANLLGVGEHGRPGIALGPCVGREAEVDALAAAVDAGGRIVVTGEEGVGKSMLLGELARRLRRTDATVAAVHCTPTPAVPLAVLADVLDALGAAAEPVHGVIDSFRGAVRSASEQRRVVLLVDDIHLAGPSTLAALASAADDPRVALVGTATTGAGAMPGGDWAEFSLGPLDGASVAAIAAEWAVAHPAAMAPDPAWLTAMSGGNPLYLEALLDERAITGRARGAAADPVEQPLAELVRGRLARLGTIVRAALEVAAVAGRDWPLAILDELAPPAGVTTAFAAELLEARPGRRADFRHGVVQRVVYDDITPGRRHELHHAIGGLLERRAFPAGTVAFHFAAALELDPNSAYDATCRAAREAAGHGAHRDAAEWYARAEQAADALAGAGEHRAVAAMIGRGDELRLSGDPAQEDVLFAAAARAFDLGDPGLVADAATAVLSLGVTTATGKPHPRVGDLVDRASRVIGEDENWARVSAVASLAYSMAGSPERCRELFDVAERLADSDPARRAVLPTAYMALGTPDDLDRRTALGTELLTRALAAHDRVAEFEARHLLFSVGLQTCDGTAVRAHLAEMQAMIDAVGDVGRRWSTLYQMAAVAHLDDRLDESERLSEAALHIFAPVSGSRAFAVYGAQLLPIRHAQGRLGELAGTFRMLVDDQPEVPAWHAALALALVDNDPEDAAVHARAALDRVPLDFAWMAAHVIGGRAAASTAALDVVSEYRARLMPYSGRACWQGTCCYGPIDLVLAMLADRFGEADEAERLRRRATQQCERLGAAVFARELAAIAV